MFDNTCTTMNCRIGDVSTGKTDMGTPAMFTVVIPLYNKADTIDRTLHSLEQQRYKEFSVVIVDDGSSDNGVAIASEHSQKLRLAIVRQNNAGVSVARNVGVSHSKSKFVAFLDADDVWHPDFLNEIFRCIERYPDYSVYGTNYVCETNGRSICTRSWFGEIGRVDFIKMWPWRCPIHTSSLVVRRDVFVAVGGFVPGHTYYEDAELLLKLSLKNKFVVSSRVLLRYCMDAQNRVTARPAPFSKMAHWIEIERLLGLPSPQYDVIQLARMEVLKVYVYSYLAAQKQEQISIKDLYPRMYEVAHKKISRFENPRTVIGVLFAWLYKFYFIFMTRRYTRTWSGR